jgi:hypothetical protein
MDPKELERLSQGLGDEEKGLVERYLQYRDSGEVEQIPTLTQFLSTPSAQVLIPKIIIGNVRRAAEPNYLVSKLLKKVRMPNASAVVMFPSVGPLRATPNLGETQEIPIQSVDWQVHRGTEIRVGRHGIRLQFSEDEINDSQWDVLGISLDEAGRAMARLKEEISFMEMMSHAHIVFDNSLRAVEPQAGTTGLDVDGNFNDTMSAEDFLDIIIAVMHNGYTPTDLIMHPLVWAVFAKNGLTGAYGKAPEGANASFQLGPQSIQGRIPFALNVLLSPFHPIDYQRRLFDIMCVDRNRIGILLEKQPLKTVDFQNPPRDIRNIQITEKYGVGIYDEGKAICVAKNISMEKTYPEAIRVSQA